MATNAEMLAVLKLRDEFSGRLGKIEKSVGKFSKKQAGATKATAGLGRGVSDLVGKFTPLNVGMLGAAGAIAAVGGAMIKAVGETIALGSQLADLSSKTGLSVQGLQELRFAGEQAGVGFDQMTSAVQRLGRRTAAELPETTKFLGAMGLTIDDILSKEPEEAFALVAEKIASIENPAQQAAAAMGVFGDAGLQVLPAINQGLDENIKRFRELGVAMSDETVAAAKKMSDSLTDLKARFEGIKTSIGAVVIPALEKMLVFFGDILPAVMQKAAAFFLRRIAEMADGIELLLRVGALLHPEMQKAADSVSNFGNKLRELAVGQDAAATANFVHAIGVEKLKKSTEGAAITTEQFSVALDKATTSVKKVKEEFPGLTDLNVIMDSWLEKTENASEAWEGLFTVTSKGIPPATAGIGDLTVKTGEARDVTDVFGSSLDEAASLMNALGVESDSALGKAISFGQRAVDVFSSVLKLVGDIGGGLGGIGSAISGLFGGGGGGGGGGLGGILGGLGGGGIGALAGLGIAGGTALVGALAGIGGRDAGTVQKEAGRDLGVSLSDGLAEAIDEAGKNIQLFLPDIFAEGNLGLDRLAEEAADLFAVLPQGKITRSETITALEQTIPILIDNFANLGDEGVAQINRILDAATQQGIRTDAIDALAARAGGGPGQAPAQAGPGAGAGVGTGSGLLLEELKLITGEVDQNGVALEVLPLIREELRQMRAGQDAWPRLFARSIRDELAR